MCISLIIAAACSIKNREKGARKGQSMGSMEGLS